MKYFLLLISCVSFIFIQAQTLQSIESVEYDPGQNRFFVSNSSSIIIRNSDGSFDFFGSGAATAGMEVMGNTLFAIDGGTVNGYDLTTEEEVMSINIQGAAFLNGMTNDGSENIYVTDFSTDKIHRINVADFDNPTSEVIVNNTQSTPNGIVYDGDNNRLIFVTWGGNAKIKAVDLADNSTSTLTTTPYGSIDGIDEDNDGNYYISYWSAGTRISKYDANFANPPETITVSGLSSPADICYAKAIDTLAIPHSGNQLTFIGFDDISPVGEHVFDESLQLRAYPNPVKEQTVIQFYLQTATDVKLNVYDQQGRLISVLMDGKQVNGTHQVLLKKLALPKGVLFVHLQVNGITEEVELLNL